MMGYDWYRERLPEALREPSVGGLIEAARPRPTYVAYTYYVGRSDLPVALPEPVVMLKVWDQPLPTPQDLEARMDLNLAGMRRSPPIDSHHDWFDTWESWAARQYVLGYKTLASGYASTGDEVGRRRALDKARSFSPWVRVE